MTKVDIKNLSIKTIDVLIFDFDGVLTDNKVHIDKNGSEFVICNRSDGLGFEAIKKLNKPTFILSSEKNLVVTARANKLDVPVIQGISNKLTTLEKIVHEKSYSFSKVFYIGNDINDYFVMQKCGYTACPNDSHPLIKKISDFTLTTKGGQGVVCELLENIFEINLLKTLYPEEC